MENKILERRINQIQMRISNSIEQITNTLDSIVLTLDTTYQQLAVVEKLDKVMEVWQHKCNELN